MAERYLQMVNNESIVLMVNRMLALKSGNISASVVRVQDVPSGLTQHAMGGAQHC